MAKTKPLKPGTEIKCGVCKGTKISPAHGTKIHSSHSAECGACFGFGLSTAPYDQARKGTMIDNARYQDVKSRLTDVKLEWLGEPDRQGRRSAMITWANTDYAERLALDQQGQLYP